MKRALTALASLFIAFASIWSQNMTFSQVKNKAEGGDADFQWMLGLCYYSEQGRQDMAKYVSGVNVTDNLDLAFYWFYKSAEQNCARAQYYLGRCFYYGEGIEKNEKLALNYYEKAAKQGYNPAKYALGGHYAIVSRSAPLVYKDKAVYWINQLAESEGESSRVIFLRELLNINTNRPTGETSGSLNGHEWVDLGLSVKWATCNIGASSPYEYGNYYAWGETTTKSSYTVANSKTYNDKTITDFAGNSLYDAATANWGKGWRMPTRNEMEEFRDVCDVEYMSHGGVYGIKITGPNGHSIFLPFGGYIEGTAKEHPNGAFYWSSRPFYDEYDRATCLCSPGSTIHFDWLERHIGMLIRPVTDK